MANPDYRAYTVIKREGKDDYWLNLGVAFRHEDGEGSIFFCRQCRWTASWCSEPTRRNQKSRRRSSRASSRSRIGSRVRPHSRADGQSGGSFCVHA